MIEDSKVFIIPDFYKDPDEIVHYLMVENPAGPWRGHQMGQAGSVNGKLFDDRRHSFIANDIRPVNDFLSELCGQRPLYPDKVKTNVTRWFDSPLNDYKNRYWWPHIDEGYNGVVYLNKDSPDCGTNLYRIESEITKTNAGFRQEKGLANPFGEHTLPWRKKKNYSIVKTFPPTYNTLVFFDGLKFPHAMNICSDRYFGKEYRLNQVFFFLQP